MKRKIYLAALMLMPLTASCGVSGLPSPTNSTTGRLAGQCISFDHSGSPSFLVNSCGAKVEFHYCYMYPSVPIISCQEGKMGRIILEAFKRDPMYGFESGDEIYWAACFSPYFPANPDGKQWNYLKGSTYYCEER